VIDTRALSLLDMNPDLSQNTPTLVGEGHGDNERSAGRTLCTIFVNIGSYSRVGVVGRSRPMRSVSAIDRRFPGDRGAHGGGISSNGAPLASQRRRRRSRIRVARLRDREALASTFGASRASS
jgi:hypothetical protein